MAYYKCTKERGYWKLSEGGASWVNIAGGSHPLRLIAPDDTFFTARDWQQFPKPQWVGMGPTSYRTLFNSGALTSDARQLTREEFEQATGRRLPEPIADAYVPQP
jgi:hypothetical protein